MPEFNDSQREAIEARNQNILVSAAAGSGKTTVMVEKIRQTLIRHPEAVDGVRIPSFGLAAEQESISFPTRQGYRLVYILFLPGGQIQKGLADDGVRAALKGKRTVFFIFLLPIIVIIRFPDELLQLTALMLGQNPGGG